MVAESNVGARLFLIGKDATLAGLKEITAGVAQMNAEIASGAGASKVASAGYAEQGDALVALQAKMDLYQANLVETTAATDSLARVGKYAFLALAAAGAAWTYESIRWAQNYQTALVQLRTQAGLTVTAMNAIGAAAMRNSVNLGISPTAYLQAAYHPASTGYGVAETVAITNYGAKLAAIGNASPEDTVNSLTSTMKAYGFKTNQTEHTAALLNAIVGSGNMHWSDLNSALSSGIMSTAKTFGVSLTSAGGALARLTDLGTPAAQAGTRLRMAMALLGAPTQESDKLLTAAGLDTSSATAASSAMASALVSAGLTTTQLSSALRDNSGAGGIYNALELLHKQLAGMSPEAQSALIARAFGGGRMGTSIMQLYSNLPALEAKSGQIDKGSTNKKFTEDWAATTKTLTFQLHALDSEIHKIGISFGETLLPPLTKVVHVFTDLLKFLDANKGVAAALGAVITGVLAPAIGVFLYRSLLSSGGAIRSVIQGYVQLFSAQTAEQAALAKTDIALTSTTGATYRLVAADRSLTGASAGSAAGGAGMKGLAGGALGKLGMGAMVAAIATPLLNQFLGKPMQKALGSRGKTDAMDALTGAEMGMMFGPEGMAAGALLGALYGERGHLKKDAHMAIHGLDAARHEGAHLFDDLFGGGGGSSSSSSSAQHVATLPRGVIRNQVYVYIDGKEVTETVVKYTKRKAARK